MTIPSMVSKRTYIARESVIGTPVAPNKFLADLNIRIRPNSTRGMVTPSGSTMDTDSPLIQNWATFALEAGSALGYETSFYTFAAMCGLPTTSTPGGGTDSREHVFLYASDGLNTRPSYSMAAGYRNGLAESVARARFDSFGFGFSRTAAPTISGGGFAQPVDMAATLGVNETNVLTIDATGGDFTMAVNGGPSTGAISESAAAGAVQTALEALANVAPGDVSVTGGAGGPYTLVWGGAYANTNVTLTTNAAGLTGGAQTAIVTTTQQGGITEIPARAVQAPEWGVFVDDEGGTIGTTRFRSYSGEFSFTGLITPDWVVDETLESFDEEVLQKPTLTANLVLRNNAQARTLYADLMDNERKLLRFRALGPVIEGALNYELRLDCLVMAGDNIAQFADNSGAETAPFPLKLISDADHFSGGFSMFLRDTVTGF